MNLTEHYDKDNGCPACGGRVTRWRGKAIHSWLEIWWCPDCHVFHECLCRSCELLKAMASA